MSLYTCCTAIGDMLADKLGLVASDPVEDAKLVRFDAAHSLQVDQFPAIEVIPQGTTFMRDMTDVTIGKPTYLVRHDVRIDCTVRGQDRDQVARLRLLFAETVRATLLLNRDVSAYADLEDRQCVVSEDIKLDVGPIEKGWSGFCTLIVSAQMIEEIVAAQLDELFLTLTYTVERLPLTGP